MRLRTRFIILITIVVTTLLVISFYTYFSFQKIQSISKTNDQVQKLLIYSLDLKAHQNNYIKFDLVKPSYFETGTSKNITKFKSRHHAILDLCNELNENKYIKSAKAQDDLQLTKNLLNKYNSTFDEFETEKRKFGFKDWGTIGKMRKAIHSVESEINKQNNNTMKIHMLMLRRHEKDYLLRRDSKYKTKFDTEYLKFKSTVKNSSLSAHMKKEINHLLDNYSTTFNTIIAKDQQIGITNKKGIMAELATTSEKAMANINHINNVISEKSEKYVNNVISLLISFIIAASVIVSLFSIFVFRGITNIMGGEPEHVALIAKNVSEGNLRVNLDQPQKAKGVMKSVLEMTDRLSEIIIGINTHSDQILQTSSIFSQTAQNISEGAFTQTSSIDRISSTIEKISTNIENNTSSARETEMLTESVKNDIHKIKDQTNQSLETSKTIAEKLNVINTIAMQTTILALNAGIEAARAGKDGQGFHVIAEEVKRLAQTSKEAADEINQLTNNNLNQASTVNQLVSEILEPIDKTSNFVKNISGASEEQSTDTTLVAQSISELYNVSQENSASSQEMAASSVELEKQAEDLKRTITYFITDQNITIKTKKNKKNKKSKDIEKVVKLWKKQNKTKKEVRLR